MSWESLQVPEKFNVQVLKNTACLLSPRRLLIPRKNPKRFIPSGPAPKPFSAGTDAADSGSSWAHKAQLLLLIDTQLVTTAPGPGCRWNPVLSLGTRRKQEAHTAGDEHMPNAMDVEVVVSGLHKRIE